MKKTSKNKYRKLPPEGHFLDALSRERIAGVVMRQYYTLKTNYLSVAEIVFWPSLDLFIWGIITKFFIAQMSGGALQIGFGMLLSAVFLYNALMRAALGFSISFLEDIWSRNLGHVFMSPLRLKEFTAGLLLCSLLRSSLGMIPAAFVTYLFFGFPLTEVGWPLLAYYTEVLIIGWCLGALSTALVQHYGSSMQVFVWVIVGLIAPISCVYYPVTALPEGMQLVAKAFPSVYIFEGIRTLLTHGTFDPALFMKGTLMLFAYVAATFGFFVYVFSKAREKGTLLVTE